MQKFYQLVLRKCLGNLGQLVRFHNPLDALALDQSHNVLHGGRVLEKDSVPVKSFIFFVKGLVIKIAKLDPVLVRGYTDDNKFPAIVQ